MNIILNNTESNHPSVFISYSHDSKAHESWILMLATRLQENGVKVELDQWNTPLGTNLQAYMEHAAGYSPRVLAVCSQGFVSKADAPKNGVGVEKNILSKRIMDDQINPLVIPILRDNLDKTLPMFLSNAKYINFNDDTEYESKLVELIYDIYGKTVAPKPPLGSSPFSSLPIPPTISIQVSGSRYSSIATTGQVEFDYTNNNGTYSLGIGMDQFETKWSGAGSRAVYAYSEGHDIHSIALAESIEIPHQLHRVGAYDFTSRVRQAETGDCIIWLNQHGRFAVTRIDSVQITHSKPREHKLVFTYWLMLDLS